MGEGGEKLYKYKFKTICGVTLEFESKYHITQLTPVAFDDVTFIRFDDNEYVIKLTEMKEVEINGVVHQLRSYAI